MKYHILNILLLIALLYGCLPAQQEASEKGTLSDGKVKEQVSKSKSLMEENAKPDKVQQLLNKQDNKSQEKQKHTEELKEKLVGQLCSYAHDLIDSKGYYIPGGFLIGFVYGEEKTINGKLFGITRIRGKKGDEKDYTTHLILQQSYEDESNPCQIADVLDVERETDLFEKYPDKDLDVMTNVAVNGKIDTELLALAVYEFDEYGEDKEVLTEIYKLWRANRNMGKFEEIKDLTGVTVIPYPH